MRSKAIIACKLEKFSALEYLLKLKSKKHAECFFKQNLKTNSAAVKQYQESLSPNGKAQVLVNESLLHIKNNNGFLIGKQKSNNMQRCWCTQETTRVPSSWKKVKILETDAAAHNKQHESLPPDDKIQILNKDDDAHKKMQVSFTWR